MSDANLPDILEYVQEELDKSVKLLAKAKDLQERKIHSEIVLNLSTVIKNFTDMLNIMAPVLGDDFDFDDDDFDFDDDYDDDDDDDAPVLKF